MKVLIISLLKSKQKLLKKCEKEKKAYKESTKIIYKKIIYIICKKITL